MAGGFFGTLMLTGYYQHGPDGQVLSSGIFDDLSNIDPPDGTTTTTTTTTTTEAPVLELPSAPSGVTIIVEDA